MTVQAAVGGSVLASVAGVGATQGQAAGPVATQATQTLAFTGASHTMLLVTVAVLMIFAGLLLNGLSRRHSDLALGSSGMGTPLRH